MRTKTPKPIPTREDLDKLIDRQKTVSIPMDRLTGFALINARRRYHKLDRQIEAICRETGMRRLP